MSKEAEPFREDHLRSRSANVRSLGDAMGFFDNHWLQLLVIRVIIMIHSDDCFYFLISWIDSLIHWFIDSLIGSCSLESWLGRLGWVLYYTIFISKPTGNLRLAWLCVWDICQNRKCTRSQHGFCSGLTYSRRKWESNLIGNVWRWFQIFEGLSWTDWYDYSFNFLLWHWCSWNINDDDVGKLRTCFWDLDKRPPSSSSVGGGVGWKLQEWTAATSMQEWMFVWRYHRILEPKPSEPTARFAQSG